MRILWRVRRLLLAPAAALLVGCGPEPKTEIPKDLNKPIPDLKSASGGGAPASKKPPGGGVAVE